MMLRCITGLLMVMISYSCASLKSEGALKIDNGINRGITYTDSSGTDFNLRYIPISIWNERNHPIHFHLTFEKEYTYTTDNGEEVFKIVPLPEAWALDNVDISDTMLAEVGKNIATPQLNATIKPGEKLVLGIGTLYPRPPKLNGILPNTLFLHNKKGNFPVCESLLSVAPSARTPVKMALKLNFGDQCMIIACGQVSYSEKD